MGYYISLQEADFFIAKDKKCDALNAVKEQLGGSRHFSWVDDTWMELETLEEVFEAWRWTALKDDEGNIANLEFEGSKLGDDETLFGALAPFVKDGSYLHMLGEESHHWKWVFEGGKLRELTGKVVFED